MPEITIEIGDRTFEVSCQDGEERYLQAAAKMLDEEAKVLAAQIGRTPEVRMLLMVGLMLADKTAGLQDKLRDAEDKVVEKNAALKQLRKAGAQVTEQVTEAEAGKSPELPESLTNALTEIAVRAEALAETVEDMQGG